MALPVIQDTVAQQNCSVCPQIKRCWVSPPSDRLRIINLLVCRLKLDIERDRTAKLLLSLLRPKVIQIAEFLHQALNADSIESDMAALITETESALIEFLMHNYVMGERGYPLHYLFGPNGAMHGWKLNYTNDARKYARTHFMLGSVAENSDANSAALNTDLETKILNLNITATHGMIHSLPFNYASAPDEDVVDIENAVTDAMRIINDGVTLPLPEYRVMAFCLKNANPSSAAKSPMYGLHTHLSSVTKLHRTRVTYLFGSAAKRLTERMGASEKLLEAQGIDAPTARRKKWADGKPTNNPLEPEEIYGLLTTAARKDLTLADVLWAYGVSSAYYYHLKTQYGGVSLEEIRKDYE